MTSLHAPYSKLNEKARAQARESTHTQYPPQAQSHKGRGAPTHASPAAEPICSETRATLRTPQRARSGSNTIGDYILSMLHPRGHSLASQASLASPVDAVSTSTK